MLGVLVVIEFEEASEPRQSFDKIRIIFLFGHCPKHFGQSRHAGQCLIFYHTLGKDILSPDVGLSTEDMTAGIGRNAIWSGIERVDFFYRDETAATAGLVLGLFALLVV